MFPVGSATYHGELKSWSPEGRERLYEGDFQ